MPPFVIFALPRSRTIWLSRFLSGDGQTKPCGHDIGAMLDSLDAIRDALSGPLAGTVETGSARGWRWLRKTFPEARFIVIRRSIEEVSASLARCGVVVPRSVLDLRSAWLDEIASRPGTVTFDAGSLDQPEICAALYRLCRGIDPSPTWLALNVGANIQLDLSARIAKLLSRAAEIDGLKAEAELADRALRNDPLPFVQIQAEPWSEQIESEGLALAEDHFEEVDYGIEPRRPFRLDCGIMRRIEAAGQLQLNTARVDGRLAGYCMWTVSLDPESAGLLIANQGPWFAADKPEYRGLNLGTTLFRRSLDDLKARGVQCVFPHHRTQGRGAKLGTFFRRMGAKEIQRGYSLWIGD